MTRNARLSYATRACVMLACIGFVGIALSISSLSPASAGLPQGKGGEIIAKPTPTPKKKPTPKASATSRTNRATGPKSGKTTPADELTFWNLVKDSTNPDDLKEFLKQFPNGTFAGRAQNRLKVLEDAKAKPDTKPDDRSGSTGTAPKAGTTLRTNIGKDATGLNVAMDFVWIAPGSFVMGSENGEANEKPAHLVTLMVTEAARQQAASADIEVRTTERELKRAKELLDANIVSQSEYEQAQIRYNEAKSKREAIRTTEGFYMSKYEVTQAQWQSVMGNNPSSFKGDNLPVEQVLWNDVQSFISKLNERGDGFKYRLPTEAEWEYACRAGATTEFAFGSSLSLSQANFDSKLLRSGAPLSPMKTTAVGSFLPNAFGLYDMHGNVWEWCQDRYHDNYVGAPADGSAWEKGEAQQKRVLRGGSWQANATNCRSASRLATPDGYNYFHDLYWGVRVVAVARTQ